MGDPMTEHQLTPTEELVMEVLSARYRLGETQWSMSTKHGKSLAALADKGMLTFRSGVTERTYLVQMTEEGRTEYVTKGYTAPLEKQLRRDVAQELLDNFPGSEAAPLFAAFIRGRKS